MKQDYCCSHSDEDDPRRGIEAARAVRLNADGFRERRIEEEATSYQQNTDNNNPGIQKPELDLLRC